MDHFRTLYDTAFAISEDIQLSSYASVGGVASALITNAGNTYTGKCLDFSCGIGFCAEHSAIAEMLKTDLSGICAIIAVRDTGDIVPPCGRCREMLMQLQKNDQDTFVYIGKDEYTPLNHLLPNYWN